MSFPEAIWNRLNFTLESRQPLVLLCSPRVSVICFIFPLKLMSVLWRSADKNQRPDSYLCCMWSLACDPCRGSGSSYHCHPTISPLKLACRSWLSTLMDLSRTTVFPKRSSSTFCTYKCFRRQKSVRMFCTQVILCFFSIFENPKGYGFLYPGVMYFYSSLVHLQKYCGLIWCHKLLCHKRRKTAFLPLWVCSPMTQAVKWKVFFPSVALASLANSTGICVSCRGIAFDMIRLLISCLSSSLPPDVFFWFTVTPRSLYSVYVWFCFLSKIPNVA